MSISDDTVSAKRGWDEDSGRSGPPGISPKIIKWKNVFKIYRGKRESKRAVSCDLGSLCFGKISFARCTPSEGGAPLRRSY